MTVGLELGAAATSIVWRMPGTHQALAVHGDDVWFWTFASPEPRWADVAGTFRVAAPSEAAALAALVVDDEPGDLPLELTVSGRTARVAAGSELGRRVGAVVGPRRVTLIAPAALARRAACTHPSPAATPAQRTPVWVSPAPLVSTGSCG